MGYHGYLSASSDEERRAVPRKRETFRQRLILVFTLTHDKKAKRLTLACVKNRFEEEHSIEIEYEPAPDGGLVFIDMATAEESKRRAENQGRASAVLEIIEGLYTRGESTKTRLFEEGQKRFKLGRRTLEPVIDNGVGVTWSCTKSGTKYIYAPLCSADSYTKKGENARMPCNDKKEHRVHDEKSAFVHDEHDPLCSCTSCTHPVKGVHVHEGRNRRNERDYEERVSDGPITDLPDPEVLA